MSYCILSQLIERYGEGEIMALVDRDQSGTPDMTLVTSVLDDVDAMIDAHLATRYALPLLDTPRVIVRIACELAREALMLANGARLDDVTPEKRAADAARGLLKDIAAGRLHIGLPTPPARSGQVQMHTGGRAWARDVAGDYL